MTRVTTEPSQKNEHDSKNLSGNLAIKNSAANVKQILGGRSLVFVGIMGVGKSTIGRRVARLLNLDFVDADTEIELAADLSVAEIFERWLP